MTTRKQGPYTKKLIITKMSQLAIPKDGSFNDGLAFLSDPEKIISTCKAATEWAFFAIDLVKTAPDNPYGDDDEAIAKAIMDKVEKQKNDKVHI